MTNYNNNFYFRINYNELLNELTYLIKFLQFENTNKINDTEIDSGMSKVTTIIQFY